MEVKGLGLKEQVLLAAVENTGGDCGKTFTMEDLLVWAWRRDKQAWGLRNYEEEHPDSDKLQKEIGSRGGDQKGLVDLGFFERVGRRVYCLTPAGIAAAASLEPSNAVSQEKADRVLEGAVKQIIEHPVFKDWLADHSRPKYFREAGHFWGIAPGTPPKTVRERIRHVDQILKAAIETLDRRGVEEIVAHRGKVLFDRNDIQRCVDFQATLKQRFGRDLRILDPDIELNRV
jgi:hypothetical protein